MGDIVIKKLKKYVLFISILFFVCLGGHLVYVYLYSDAEAKPIEGGTVSEAIIGSFPNFNPLIPATDNNAYINELLYRSLMQYSTNTGKLESDLASCDLENLLSILCTIEPNITWSDGTMITTDDIQATFEIIKQTRVNPIVASLLDETTISISENRIRFTNEAKDIGFLEVFLQPIVPKRVVEKLNTENITEEFSEINGVYSGRFVLSSISQDENVGITKITLGKNENYFGNDMYIQYLILSLFEDEDQFLKNKNSFNIFNDRNGLIGSSIPRLEVYEYTLPQFVTSFFNIERLTDQDLRSYISRTLSRQRIIENVGADTIVPAYNPFLTEQNIDGEYDSLDIQEYLQARGYKSKSELLSEKQAEITEIQAQNRDIAAELQEENEVRSQNTISGEIAIFQEAPLDLAQSPSTSEQKIQEDLEYIFSPSAQKYNFISSNNILLQGNVPSGVEAVFIGDYELQGFTPGDSIFNYRISTSFGTLSEGENSYEVYFQENGQKRFIEEIVYIYYADTATLREREDGYFDAPETNLQAAPTLFTPEETENAPNQLLEVPDITQVENLDENLYYDQNLNPFELTVIYAQTDVAMEQTVEVLPELFAEKGISISLVGMPLSVITEQLRDESLIYDIMIIGINLGSFDADIFPYFHSSQVENGYNFSNYQKLSLDILLEELKSNNLTPTKKEELQEKMLKIFAEENILKVLYTPKIQLLVDKNIKNFYFPDNIPDARTRYFPLLGSYLEEEKIINTENKGLVGFIRYLLQELFS